MASAVESPARALAARVLARVWSSDAYAAAALDAELRPKVDLSDPRDAALATELVYGVLRTQNFLEDRVAAFATSRRWTADPAVRARLLMGAYALCFLDRIPPFAAVADAVAGIRAARGPRVAGFANAVLRKMAADSGALHRRPLAAAIASSAPGWLRGALRRSLGRAGAEAFLAAGPVPPPAGLCLAPAEDRGAWIDALRRAAPDAEIAPGAISPRAILLRGAGDARRLPGFGEAWIGQEEGAQVVALALGATRQDTVLDACAGRGNKTWLLARIARAVDAADLHPDKLERAAATGARATYGVDWTVGSGDVPEAYDRILVDAPCSGVGTLRRRPEIAHRRREDDLRSLSDLQFRIALRAAARARDGGRLVYAVCSVLGEECEAVVERLAGAHEDPQITLEAAPFEDPAIAALSEGGATFRLLPHLHGTDGYFAAMLVVRRRPCPMIRK